MSITRLFRVLVRQRVRFSATTDITAPEATKPFETEGNSIERDVTDFVKGYSIPRSREALSAEASVNFISPQGALNPENFKSEYNLSPLDGSTYTPLLAEGNEILIYQIPTEADIATRAKWVQRFSGRIRSIEYGTEQGQDTLSIVAGDVLSLATTATVTGTFSPIVRTNSVIPSTSFYTQATLQTAVDKLRTINKSYVAETYSDLKTPIETGEISADTLARLIFWDRDDIYWALGWDIARAPRFIAGAKGEPSASSPSGSTRGSGMVFSGSSNTVSTMASIVGANFTSMLSNEVRYIGVSADTSRAVFGLNGASWLVASGTVSKDNTRKLMDSSGSMKLQGATIQFCTGILPVNSPSKFRLYYRLEDASSIHIRVRRRSWNRSSLSWNTGFDTGQQTLLDSTITGTTTFDASKLPGRVLNTPQGTTYEFREISLDIAAFAPSYGTDWGVNACLYEVEISTNGSAWIDAPRWEFTMIDRDSTTGHATFKETNIYNVSSLERWVTEDGITYRDPHESHRALMPKSLRVVGRRLRAPYFAGTSLGYGPVHLKNRSLPESYVYQTELIEGQDYEVLVDKGAIQLSSEMSKMEIFVAHGYYDLAASGHMEASTMLKWLLQKGAGIPRVVLEPIGIILNRIELGVRTTTTVMSAIQDLLRQVPGNYHMFADGAGTVRGRFIQQEGSPRIFNPIIQTPIEPTTADVLTDGSEMWYGLTNLMPDGKETLVSNIMSTVEYQNYFDGAHESKVTGRVCPAISGKMAPNAVGLVVRRAKAYKKVSDLGIPPSVSPAYKWDFNGATPFVSGGCTLTNPGGFTIVASSTLNVEGL